MAILILTTNNRAEASVDNVSYILREDAVACWATHNIEEVKDKTDALTYADRRAFEEELKPLYGASQRRNHLRMKLTFADEDDPNTALLHSKQFLEKNFPQAKIIYSSHKDTDNCHVHCWIDARETTGKKLHLSNSKFYKLGEEWSKHCDRIYGTNYTEQFKQSRKQNNQNKKDGIEPPKSTQNQKLKENQEKNEQKSIRIGEQLIKTANRAITNSERKINELEQINEYGNKSELARIGRENMERKRRSDAEQGKNQIRPSNKSQEQPTPNRDRKIR